MTRTVIGITHSGPLPDAAEFRRYEAVFPGAADRILRMAENSLEADNEAVRAEAESLRASASSVREDAATVRRGQYLFAVMSMACMAGGVGLAALGQGVLSTVAVTGSVIGFLGILIRPVSPDRWRPTDTPSPGAQG